MNYIIAAINKSDFARWHRLDDDRIVYKRWMMRQNRGGLKRSSDKDEARIYGRWQDAKTATTWLEKSPKFRHEIFSIEGVK